MTDSNTSVPTISFADQGPVLPSEADILSGVVADINAAFGNALTFYDAAGTFLPSRPQSQIATTQSAVIFDAMTWFLWLANNVDPNVAEGRMQDAIGAIYAIVRKPGAATSVTAICSGGAGTLIPAGSRARDVAGNVYASTADATIGGAGTVSVVFNATILGPIDCAANSLTQIYQIIPGWDAITNPTSGIVGSNVETRADFEARRSASVAVNASGTVAAIQASVRSVAGVIDAYVTDNPSGTDLTIGGVLVPAHNVLVAVAGGDDAAIARAIYRKKPPGPGMAGNTTVALDVGLPSTYSITFQRALALPMYVRVTLSNSSQVPSTFAGLVADACMSAFAGAGIEARSAGRIGVTAYASDFYPDIEALGSWVRIVRAQVSTDGATWSDTVQASVAQIFTLDPSQISVVLQ